MFDRDYSFIEEDTVIPYPLGSEGPKDYIVICKMADNKNKTFIGPFTLEEAEYYAKSSPYENCKHKVRQLFNPDTV